MIRLGCNTSMGSIMEPWNFARLRRSDRTRRILTFAHTCLPSIYTCWGRDLRDFTHLLVSVSLYTTAFDKFPSFSVLSLSQFPVPSPMSKAQKKKRFPFCSTQGTHEDAGS
jgi:hypothetical protein